MSKDQLNDEHLAAICADSKDDQAILRAYVRTRGWKPSGHVYRFEEWPKLLAAAQARKFNMICASYGGLRWLVQVAPETDFPRTQRRPTRGSEPIVASDEQQPVIIERACALTSEKPQSAETIAASLLADGQLTGRPAGTARRVRRALLRSGEFAAVEPAEGGPMLWRRWAPTTKSVDQADGRRIIYTEVLSTTGVPVQIAIPVKSPKEIAEILLQEVLADPRWMARKEDPKPDE